MCRTNKIAGQESENMSDKMIGCLCRFWDSDSGYKIVGILHYIDHTAVPYQTDNGEWYCYCEPVKPEEIKFYEED